MFLTKWGDRIAIYFGVWPVCKYHHRKVMNAGSFDDLPESYRDEKLLEVLDHPDNQMARIFLGTDHVFLTPSEENRGLPPIAVSQLPSPNCRLSPIALFRIYPLLVDLVYPMLILIMARKGSLLLCSVIKCISITSQMARYKGL